MFIYIVTFKQINFNKHTMGVSDAIQHRPLSRKRHCNPERFWRLFNIPEFMRNERNSHCDVRYYTLPPLESPDSSWMTRSQRSRRRDKGLLMPMHASGESHCFGWSASAVFCIKCCKVLLTAASASVPVLPSAIAGVGFRNIFGSVRIYRC